MAVVWAHVGFEQGNIQRLQLARQLPELAKLFGVDPQDGTLLKRLQIERAELHPRHCDQLLFHFRTKTGFNEGDRRLFGQQDFQGPRVRCQPVFNFGARWRVPPAAGQDESLLSDGHHVSFGLG